MAYSKLQLGVRDFPVGFRTINQLRDNFVDIYEALDDTHGVLEERAGVSPPPARRYGHHDSMLIPRAELLFTPTAVFGAAAPQVAVSGGTAGFIAQAGRYGDGEYFFTVAGLATAWARAEPRQTSSPIRWVHCITCDSTVPGAQPTVILLNAYELSGTAFVLTDFAFNVTLYGTT